jgi:DNA-binding GntR family transcriptional regulator
MLPRAAPFARPGLIRHEVYDHLKGEILSGKLPSGSRLAEIALAERLGVSRTPVREAVQRLAQDGLVEVMPNRGAKVKTVSTADVEDVYAVREVLDGLAARLAATHRTTAQLEAMRTALAKLERADPEDFEMQIAADLEFHAVIAAGSGNPTLTATLTNLSENVARVKLLSKHTNQSETTRTAHHQLLQAIAKRDAGAAEHLARAHVLEFRAIILKQLQHERIP